MKIFQKVLAILAIVIPLCQNIHASTCDSTSLSLMEQTWREFRAIHPFGFQTVGLKHKGDTCIFVISEPAEWVKTEDLVALFTKHDGHLIECIQPYGYDGELHDFVGCLRKDSINSQLFRSELFNLLYFTDYKAYYTDLDHPTKHIYFSNKKINFEIESYKLRLSLFNERFKVSTKKNLSFDNLMKSKTISNKLYFSQERGYVVWVLDSIGVSRTDSVFLKTARKFALDTDIILGSILENEKVAIIGREREVPVNILPPLRSETICQLLTCGNRRLIPTRLRRMIDSPYALGYQNNPWLVFNSLKTDSVQTDIYYAPILISKNVRDTELGNLMYLTDIILKSWCENGKVKDSFINYPLPQSYPYPNGIIHEFGDSLGVCWTMLEPLFGISSYRTGSCLPEISFFAKRDSIQIVKEAKMSSKMYSYFAGQKCIDLVRIRQYSILLNAFQFLTVGQSELHGTSRQKTPSITVSNKKWIYGGYLPLLQVGPQVGKGLARGLGQGAAQRVGQGAAQRVGQGAVQRVGQGAAQRVGQGAAQRVGQGAAQRAGQGVAQRVGQGATQRVGQGVVGGATQIFVPVSPLSNIRKDVIHPQPSGTKRGFDSKTHNTYSKSQLLSDSEKQDLFDKSDREKKMMDDLRKQLRQFNIPVKVIQNEQRIIIHAINNLYYYDREYEYEWAA